MSLAGPAVAQESSDQSHLRVYSERLDEFEQVLRELTGRVETLEHQLRQANRRIEQLEDDQAAAQDSGSAEVAANTGQDDGEETLEDFDETGGAGAEANDQSEPRSLGTLPSDEEEDTQGEAGAGTESASADGNLPSGSTTEQYNYAFGLLQEAKWEQAEAALSAFVQEHPDDRLAGNAKYWLGETHYVRQDYIEAAQTFAEGYKDYPDSNKAADNLLKLGMSLANLEQTEDACGTFEELEARYSDAPSRILERSRSEREKLGC
ncbi:tol-pal system protein YbgF [Fodinicurvata halophila]